MTSSPDRVVEALLEARLLDPASRRRALAVVGEAMTTPAPRRRGLPQLVEVVGYLGGALVLAATSLFMLGEWGDLGFVSQVAVLSVASLVLLVAGFVAAQVPGGRDLREAAYAVRRRLAGSLLAGAALTAGLLVGDVVGRVVTGGYLDWTTLAAAGATCAVGVVGYRLAPTALGVVVVLGGLATAVPVAGVRLGAQLAGVGEGDVAGVLLVLTAVAWLPAVERGRPAEVSLARALGVVVALTGAQWPVLGGSDARLGYLLTAAAAAVGIAVYLRSQAWPYLALAVAAVTLVVPEAVGHWTGGSLGAVGAVLVTGVTLLVASFAGYRLRSGALA